MIRFFCSIFVVFMSVLLVCGQTEPQGSGIAVSPPLPSSQNAPNLDDIESLFSPGITTPASQNSETKKTVGVGERTNGDSVSSEKAENPPQQDSIWYIIKSGGTIGWIIIILSVVAGALVVEYLVTIRLNVLVPPEEADAIFQALQAGNRAKAMTICQEQGGFLGNTILAGLTQPGTNWGVIEKAIEDAISEQAGRLYRRVDYLSLIGNIAPMLGLLGTVVGMIVAFRDLALSDGFAHGADLAEGIYLALITTVEGLMVAIPALFAHTIFTNRVSNIVGDATYTIEQIIRPVKQWALQKESTETAQARSSGGAARPTL